MPDPMDAEQFKRIKDVLHDVPTPHRIMALVGSLCEKEREVGLGRAAVSAIITIGGMMAARHPKYERQMLVAHMKEELAALENTLLDQEE